LKDPLVKDPSNLVSHAAAIAVLGDAVAELAKGMEELSNGLRATYILLEQVQSGSRR
jgi:hypothetical protein